MEKPKSFLNGDDCKNAEENMETEAWNHYLCMIMMNIPDSILIADENFKIIHLNKYAEALFGYEAVEMIGKTPGVLNTNLMADEIKNSIYETASAGKTFIYEALTRRKDGTTFICEYKITLISANGFPDTYVGVQRDVAEKSEVLNELLNNNYRFDQLTSQSHSIAWEVDKKGRYTYVSNSVQDVLGYKAEDAIGKMYFYDRFPESTKEKLKNEALQIYKRKDFFVNYVNIAEHKNGEMVYLSTNGIPMMDEFGMLKGYRGFDVDITEKMEKQLEIEYLNFHDHLTGLYNRRYVEVMINKLDVEQNLPFSVMVLDVNGLKLINDAFGHEMGDKLLKNVAEIMKAVCRTDDIIGRMGGDEFYILLPKTGKEQAESLKQKIMLAAAERRLGPVIVSLSAGYAVKSDMNQDIKVIQATADNNMYKEKLRSGKFMKSRTIEAVIKNINIIHDNEQNHSKRVSELCEKITRAMNFNEKETLNLKMSGALHDIGKIMIPPELLNRQDRLTSDEFEIIKRHPEIGYQILKSVDEYAPLAESVLYHHEKWDGNGYPEGLSGKSIPLYSRILAVADAYEIMTGKYKYNDFKSEEEVRKELESCSGKDFDPEIVRIFQDKVLLEL